MSKTNLKWNRVFEKDLNKVSTTRKN